jgi:hypothetical protein
MNFLTQLWNTVKSQAWFVTVTSAIGGALLDLGQDYLTSGTLDFSPAGLKKMITVVLVAIVAGLIHLYRPSPLQSASNLQNKIGLVALLVFLFSASAMAQSGATFTGSTEVTALHFNGSWSPANHTTESLDLIDWGPTKANSLAIEGHQLTAPTPSLNAYMGGVRITPDISSLLSKTNVAPGQFGVFAQGAVGVGTLPSTNNIAFFLGGGANYRMTSNLSWSTVDFRVGRVGAQSYYEISSGIQYIFNPTSAKAASAQRFLALRAAKARAAAAVEQ